MKWHYHPRQVPPRLASSSRIPLSPRLLVSWFVLTSFEASLTSESLDDSSVSGLLVVVGVPEERLSVSSVGPTVKPTERRSQRRYLRARSPRSATRYAWISRDVEDSRLDPPGAVVDSPNGHAEAVGVRKAGVDCLDVVGAPEDVEQAKRSVEVTHRLKVGTGRRTGLGDWRPKQGP